jgi:hypothetical protein
MMKGMMNQLFLADLKEKVLPFFTTNIMAWILHLGLENSGGVAMSPNNRLGVLHWCPW